MIISEIVSYAKYVGLFVGGIFLILYWIKFRKQAQLEQAISSILCGSGMVGGAAVILLSFSSDICDFDIIGQVYVILGGLSVSWISFTSFNKLLQNRKER